MKTIVTGGCGFIGSHLVDKLIELNHDVIVIDNLSAESNEQFYFNENAKYYSYDITDYNFICPLFENVDYVFHLAAEARIQPTLKNPILCFKTNAFGTQIVLQCARESNCKKVIYSSTSSAYGRKNKVPLNENMETDCLTPYSVAKVAGEQLCKNYNDLFGLKTITLRYFNVYGPREPVKGSYAPVIGLFLRQFKNKQPLTIVGDGLQKRDFTYIDDVINANIKAMEYDGSKHGEIFNIGTGKTYSILELARMISNKIEFIPERPGESRETLADNIKAYLVLRWAPNKYIEDYIKEQLSKE